MCNTIFTLAAYLSLFTSYAIVCCSQLLSKNGTAYLDDVSLLKYILCIFIRSNVTHIKCNSNYIGTIVLPHQDTAFLSLLFDIKLHFLPHFRKDGVLSPILFVSIHHPLTHWTPKWPIYLETLPLFKILLLAVCLYTTLCLQV